MQVRKGWFAQYVGDQLGATALEFALIATPLLALVLMGLQLAVLVFFDQALQTVTAQAGRTLMVGAAQKAGLTQQQFGASVCALAPSAFSCSKLMIDVESYSTFSSANTSPLTPTYTKGVLNPFAYNPGGPGSIVVIRLMYDWPVISGPFGFGLSNQPDGGHLLVGTAVVKNEPYQ